MVLKNKKLILILVYNESNEKYTILLFDFFNFF
jgi:hypothetical protein